MEGEEDKEVESERYEVLNGETPPVFENGLPPVNLGLALVLAKLSHRSGELTDTRECDI